MKALIFSEGIHPPLNEGTVNYTLSVVRGIKKVNPHIRFSLFSPIRTQYVKKQSLESNKSDFLQEYFEERIYTEPSRLFKSLLTSEADIPVLLCSANDAWMLLKTIKQMGKQRQDASLFHSINFSPTNLRIIGKLCSVPLVHTYLSKPQINTYGMNSIAKACICVSKRVFEECNRSGNGRGAQVSLIPPPVDMEIFKPTTKKIAKRCIGLENSKFLLLYMGNITPERFAPDFLGVIKKIADSFDIIFYVVCPLGPTNIRCIAAVKKAIEDLNLESVVKVVMKNLSELEKAHLLQAADIMVTPFSESVHHVVEPPLSVMEALAVGTPVIASKVASIGDIVNETNGILMDPYNEESQENWCKSIKALLSDSSKMSELSMNAALQSEAYSQENISRKILSVWQRIID